MTEAETATVIKHETFYLWWENEEGKRFPAGVAFYHPGYGEYRLKLDMFPGLSYYLRTTETKDDEIHYQVEAVLRRHGRFLARKAVGEGVSNKDYNDGDICISLYPFEKTLVLVSA